jgi:hypothetical protein
VARIDRLIGVYDADGSVLGELAYVVGHALGRRSCALCDITHGSLRRKPAFDDAAGALEVPFELLHRDEQPAALGVVTAGQLPCVVSDQGGELAVLLDRGALAECHGDPVALIAAIRAAAAAQGMDLDAA